MYIRLALLVLALVAVSVFHASGNTLLLLRAARIVLVVLIVLGAGMTRRLGGRGGRGSRAR